MKQRVSYRRLAFYVVAAAILLYVKFSELRILQDFFKTSNFAFLGIIIVIQFLSYLFQAINYRVVLAMKGLWIGVWELFPISFVVQFISQAVPTAGISGQAFLIYYLRKHKLTLAEGIGRAILELVTLYLVHALYFIITIVLLFKFGLFGKEPKLIYFVYAFIFFLAFCMIIVLLSQERQRDSRLQWIFDRISRPLQNSNILNLPGIRTIVNHEHFQTVKDQFKETLNFHTLRQQKWLFLQACFWQVLLLGSHIITLYVIAIAIGHPISFTASMTAFTFAKFISMISIIPGAPGVFEGIMVLVLITFGIDKSVAFGVTLLTRAFTFWLPMPIGWVLYGIYTRRFEKLEQM
jgi:uncharacterized protein (TIRG00374 family)